MVRRDLLQEVLDFCFCNFHISSDHIAVSSHTFTSEHFSFFSDGGQGLLGGDFEELVDLFLGQDRLVDSKREVLFTTSWVSFCRRSTSAVVVVHLI